MCHGEQQKRDDKDKEERRMGFVLKMKMKGLIEKLTFEYRPKGHKRRSQRRSRGRVF